MGINNLEGEAFCSLLKESREKIDLDLYNNLLNYAKHRNWVRVDILLKKIHIDEMNESLYNLYLLCPR